MIVGLEETKEGEVLGVCLVMFIVVNCSDTPYHLAIALGKEELDPSMLVEGVLLRVELLPLPDQQRRHPVRVLSVLSEGIFDEPLKIGIDEPP